MQLPYTVYVLKCQDGFYIGCTDDISDRILRHQNGYVPATKDRRPLELEQIFGFKDKHKAYNFEKYLKSGSGRAFLNKHFGEGK